MIRLMILAACFCLGSGWYMALRARQFVMVFGLTIFLILIAINSTRIISVLSGGAE